MSVKLTKLLIFDDDYNHAQYLKTYLTEVEGYEVVLTAQENVSELLHTEKFDLVCVDIMIQSESLNENDEVTQNLKFDGIPWQQTGLEFLRRLRTGEYSTGLEAGTPPEVPVLILSAIGELPEDGPIDKAWLKVQNIDHIEKPFDLENLLEKISILLQGASA